MILDIRTDKTVADMNLKGLPARAATRYRSYGDLCAERLGRWHVVYADRSEGYVWGDDLVFFP